MTPAARAGGRDAEAEQGHDDVLRRDAEQHRQRLPDHEREIRQGQGQPHAEHDQHQGRVDEGRQAGEGRGEEQRQRAAGEDQEGEEGHRDAGAAFFGAGRCRRGRIGGTDRLRV